MPLLCGVAGCAVTPFVAGSEDVDGVPDCGIRFPSAEVAAVLRPARLRELPFLVSIKGRRTLRDLFGSKNPERSTLSIAPESFSVRGAELPCIVQETWF